MFEVTKLIGDRAKARPQDSWLSSGVFSLSFKITEPNSISHKSFIDRFLLFRKIFISN